MPLAAVVAVFTAVLGLAALALMAVTVFGQVRSLGRTVTRASDRITAASSDVPPRDGNP